MLISVETNVNICGDNNVLHISICIYQISTCEMSPRNVSNKP